MTNNTLFDMVHDCQRLFRLILHAMANPGIWVDYMDIVGKFEENGLLMPLLLTLCDTEAGYWLQDCSESLAQEVAMLCGAVEKSLADADFIFVTEAGAPHDVLHQARPGSFVDPHDSATVFVLLPHYDATVEQEIRGPGVPPGGRLVEFPRGALPWLRARRKMAREYPLGLDLVLIHPEGRLLGLPRTMKG